VCTVFFNVVRRADAIKLFAGAKISVVCYHEVKVVL
jgi:hypothetical protein